MPKSRRYGACGAVRNTPDTGCLLPSVPSNASDRRLRAYLSPMSVRRQPLSECLFLVHLSWPWDTYSDIPIPHRHRKLRFCETVLWRLLDDERALPWIWIGPEPAHSGRTEGVYHLLSSLFRESFYRIHRGFYPEGLRTACHEAVRALGIRQGIVTGFWRDLCVAEVEMQLSRCGARAMIERRLTAAAPY
jgi:hypothetical protein